MLHVICKTCCFDLRFPPEHACYLIGSRFFWFSLNLSRFSSGRSSAWAAAQKVCESLRVEGTSVKSLLVGDVGGVMSSLVNEQFAAKIHHL